MGRQTDSLTEAAKGKAGILCKPAGQQAGKADNIQAFLQNKAVYPGIPREKNRVWYKNRRWRGYGYLCVYPQRCSVLRLNEGEKAAFYAPAAYFVLTGREV